MMDRPQGLSRRFKGQGVYEETMVKGVGIETEIKPVRVSFTDDESIQFVVKVVKGRMVSLMESLHACTWCSYYPFADRGRLPVNNAEAVSLPESSDPSYQDRPDESDYLVTSQVLAIKAFLCTAAAGRMGTCSHGLERHGRFNAEQVHRCMSATHFTLLDHMCKLMSARCPGHTTGCISIPRQRPTSLQSSSRMRAERRG
ncbi:hypothetical protein F4778DRAFT_407986 [Xylariomycetidae sp. FL2044]|nr:hypothetical protein F4778DRAFT_407986 [Xylariomycetidae sp. FL2044]